MKLEGQTRASERLYKRYCDSNQTPIYLEGALGKISLLAGALICIPIENLIIGIGQRRSRRSRRRNLQI